MNEYKFRDVYINDPEKGNSSLLCSYNVFSVCAGGGQETVILLMIYILFVLLYYCTTLFHISPIFALNGGIYITVSYTCTTRTVLPGRITTIHRPAGREVFTVMIDSLKNHGGAIHWRTPIKTASRLTRVSEATNMEY